MADELVKPRKLPTVNAPSSRVTIALPFSQIKTSEASDATRELAGLVVALAEQIAKLNPGPETDDLYASAQGLMTKL